MAKMDDLIKEIKNKAKSDLKIVIKDVQNAK